MSEIFSLDEQPSISVTIAGRETTSHLVQGDETLRSFVKRVAGDSGFRTFSVSANGLSISSDDADNLASEYTSVTIIPKDARG